MSPVKMLTSKRGLAAIAIVVIAIGSAAVAMYAGSGTIRFRPAFGPAGRRSVVAMITHEGLPAGSQQLGSFVATTAGPNPPMNAEKNTATKNRKNGMP